MAKNQKAIKVLCRLFDAGFDTEKMILNMNMEEMLKLPGITVPDLAIINELQKHIKSNKVISYLSGSKEADGQSRYSESRCSDGRTENN